MTIRKSSKLAHCAAAALLALGLTTALPAQEMEDDFSSEPTSEDTSAEDTTASDDSENETTEETTDEPAADETTADTPAPDAEDTPQKPSNPRRADSFGDALQAAGDDGIAVYCYGPNWNRRSKNMLIDFWKTPELEAATGSAILVAVPYYEDPTEEQKARTQAAASGMGGPPHGVCPTVMLFDKNGTKYADLVGADYLGTEENSYETAYKNLRAKISELHKRDEILQQAQSMPAGAEKAKFLNKITELSIMPPPGFVEMLREADPNDSSGMIRRNTFKALDFLYEQMHTKDGFLSPDFEEDLQSIEAACLKVAKDETLKPLDRQAAYLLLIGSYRRHEISGVKLKQLITACAKIDPGSKYGRLATYLSDKWASAKYSSTSEDRKNKRAQERKKEKDRKNKDRDEKRAAKNSEVR